jgi:hypothetical protein
MWEHKKIRWALYKEQKQDKIKNTVESIWNYVVIWTQGLSYISYQVVWTIIFVQKSGTAIHMFTEYKNWVLLVLSRPLVYMNISKEIFIWFDVFIIE